MVTLMHYPEDHVAMTTQIPTLTEDICDRLCENQPCLHLVVITETLV